MKKNQDQVHMTLNKLLTKNQVIPFSNQAQEEKVSLKIMKIPLQEVTMSLMEIFLQR
jgi:hypothetical protein